MHFSALRGNFESERMSFTAAINLTQAYAFAFLKAKSTAEREKLIEQFTIHMGQAKLPKRSKDRSYPRVVKYPRDKYPKRGIVKDYNSEKERK